MKSGDVSECGGDDDESNDKETMGWRTLCPIDIDGDDDDEERRQKLACRSRKEGGGKHDHTVIGPTWSERRCDRHLGAVFSPNLG